jgi:hypothetical protein
MNFKSPPIHRTPLYRAKSAYCSMVVRCENTNGKNPAYKDVKLKMTLEEWLNWAIPQYEAFDRQYPDISPSVSRHGDKGHYEIGNLSIEPFYKNRISQNKACRLKPDGTKICTRCKEAKDARDFCKRAGSFDGLTYWCRSCCSLAQKKRKKKK